MGKSSAVQPPDPAATAAAQGEANRESALATAQLNQVNQRTPFGNLTFSGDFPFESGAAAGGTPGTPATSGFWRPGTSFGGSDGGAGGGSDQSQPIWVPGTPGTTGTTGTANPVSNISGGPRTATLTLPEAVQRALNSQNNVTAGLSSYAEQFVPRALEGLQQPFSLEGLPDAPQASSQERQRIEDALFGRLEPYLTRDQQALDTKFANQGITQGSEAFRGGQDDFSRARNDARLATVGVAGDEYARSFGLETSARSNALNERLLGRTQPINEIAALLQGGPAINSPQFGQPGGSTGVAPADFTGAVGQNIAAQNANVQSKNADAASRNALIGTTAMAGALAVY